MANVSSIPLPNESIIASLYKDANLADAFAVKVPRTALNQDITKLAFAVLGHPPAWFRALLNIRDRAVSIFGIKTTSELEKRTIENKVDHISFFRIIKRSNREVILGENDSHLDFRLSILVRELNSSQCELVATSVVHCHNRFGRAYIAVISPFHWLVVRSNLGRSIQWI